MNPHQNYHQHQQQQQQQMQQHHHHQQHLGPPGPNGGSPDLSAGPPWPGTLPSLHLYSLNDTFTPKMIHLPADGTHVKIGRQTNAKTVPGERNGYFDSKVLSRTHAEVWSEGGKSIFIKDVKSSNGTFVNGDRLSGEGIESEPYELKSDDHVEFGIDIVGEDNKTIVHHKVSSKAFCVFNQADVEASLREYQAHQAAAQRYANNRRNAGKPTGPNVNDLTRQIATELQKSRETAADLHNLHSAMSDIHETLGGGIPPPISSLVHPDYPPPPIGNVSQQQPPEELLALRSQLVETQAQLGDNVARVQTLESRLKEHEAVRGELDEMRERIKAVQLRVERNGNGSGRQRGGGNSDEEEEEDGDDGDDDDDDNRSVATVRMHGKRMSYGDGETGGEDDEEDDEEDVDDDVKEHEMGVGAEPAEEETTKEERERLGRPSTPEPGSEAEDKERRDIANTAIAIVRDAVLDPAPSPPSRTAQQVIAEEEERRRAQEELQKQLRQQLIDTQQVLHQNQALTTRLDGLGSELGAARALSRTLETQHATALTTVSLLEKRVSELEGQVGVVESKWEVWRSRMEEAWRKEREVWESERERMRSVVREWEEAKRRAEEEDEERRLNEEAEEEEWAASRSAGGGSGSGNGGGLGANSNDKGGFSGAGGASGIGGDRFDSLRNAAGQRDRSSTPTPTSSPHRRAGGSGGSDSDGLNGGTARSLAGATGGNFSSLRSLLNPLARPHQSRGSVPSAFRPPLGGRTPSGDAVTVHPLRKSGSVATIKGPVSPPPPSASSETVGAATSLNESNGSQLLDEIEEDEQQQQPASPTGGPRAVNAQAVALSAAQLQGAVFVGTAVAALVLAINYDRVATFYKSLN